MMLLSLETGKLCSSKVLQVILSFRVGFNCFGSEQFDRFRNLNFRSLQSVYLGEQLVLIENCLLKEKNLFIHLFYMAIHWVAIQ